MKQQKTVPPGMLLNEQNKRPLGKAVHGSGLNRDREVIRKARLTQWERVLILSERYTLELVITEERSHVYARITLTDLDGLWAQSRMLTSKIKRDLGSRANGTETADREAIGRDCGLHFDDQNGKKRLYGYAENFRNGEDLHFDVTFRNNAGETLMMEAPDGLRFVRVGGGVPVTGVATLGRTEYLFAPAHSCAMTEQGTGCEANVSERYTVMMSTDVRGCRIALALSEGAGVCPEITGSALFYNGRVHPLTGVRIIRPEGIGTSAWWFVSDDDRLKMQLIPAIESTEMIRAGLKKRWRTGITGTLSGEVVLDDGAVVRVKDRPGRIEILRGTVCL